MAVNPNVEFVSGDILLASQQNRFPRGVMGYVVRGSGNVALTTTPADITGLSITFTAEANRGYKIIFNSTVQKDGTAGYGVFQVTDASNVISFEIVQGMTSNGYTTVALSQILTGLTAGSKTLKMRGFVNATTATLLASVDNKTTFAIEDIGPV